MSSLTVVIADSPESGRPVSVPGGGRISASARSCSRPGQRTSRCGPRGCGQDACSGASDPPFVPPTVPAPVYVWIGRHLLVRGPSAGFLWANQTLGPQPGEHLAGTSGASTHAGLTALNYSETKIASLGCRYGMTMIDFLESWIDDLCDHDQGRLESARLRAEIGLAGAALRRLRSEPRPQASKRWTGRIGHGRRGFIGQTVVLPDRSLGRLLAARRGWTCVAHVDPFSVWSNRISYVPANDVQPYKHPCAVALGRLKAGRREKLSKAKARACRRNGHLPPRKGSRPRGRPRATSVGAAAPSRMA